MEAEASAIEVENLTKRYSRRAADPPALFVESLKVPVGKICCVLGPNGSGKTTLLKTLAGLIKPTSGHYSILGLDPIAHRAQIGKTIGWMPAEERSGFYGRLTAKENLSFFSSLYGLPASGFGRLIGNLSLLLGIGPEMERMMLKASAGERQKIGLARTLLHNPAVLILDEPLRNLDPHTVLRVRRLLKHRLSNVSGKTILMSTHLLEEARRIADMIIILHKGKIIKTVEALELEKETKKTSIEKFYMKIIDDEEK